MHNKFILERLNTPKEMALRLDQGMKNLALTVVKQAEILYDGAERLSWYTSCLTDNYQDVCTNLKNEDLRFVKQVASLVEHYDVILKMIEIYIDRLVSHLSFHEIVELDKKLGKMGANIYASGMTNKAIALAISSTITYGFSINREISSKLNFGVVLVSFYGRFQQAAQAVNRLKTFDPGYYQALYLANVEMFYFLIEDKITHVGYINPAWSTNEQISNAIINLMN